MIHEDDDDDDDDVSKARSGATKRPASLYEALTIGGFCSFYWPISVNPAQLHHTHIVLATPSSPWRCVTVVHFVLDNQSLESRGGKGGWGGKLSVPRTMKRGASSLRSSLC